MSPVPRTVQRRRLLLPHTATCHLVDSGPRLARLRLGPQLVEAGGTVLVGQVHLDQGAVDALINRGKSLLASGILQVTGPFEAGDPVSCVDTDGKEFAKGLVNVSSDLLGQMKGLKTTDIHEQFGPQEYEEVIHRDNLVIL